MQPTASEALTLRTSEFTYPGAAEHIRAVRADLRPLLADCPVAEDVILCASELAANATLHSNSRLPGGTFTVRVAISACDQVRIEIEDNGGPWTQVPVTPSGTMGSTSSASWPLTGESTATRSLVPPGLDSTGQLMVLTERFARFAPIVQSPGEEFLHYQSRARGARRARRRVDLARAGAPWRAMRRRGPRSAGRAQSARGILTASGLAAPP